MLYQRRNRLGLCLLGLCLSAIAVLGATSTPTAAQTVVDLELVLAIDASWSVSEDEFALQMDAIAAAFSDPEVIEVISKIGERGIAVALLQWAGYGEQRVAVDWSVVRDAASAQRFAERVDAADRLLIGATDISGALTYATRMVLANGYEAARKVIDISGDGPSNEGFSPRGLRPSLIAAGITVNGLPILSQEPSEEPELGRYFTNNVIAGPGAFLMPASGYKDFARALRAKLLREIRGQAVVQRETWKGPPRRAEALTKVDYISRKIP